MKWKDSLAVFRKDRGLNIPKDLQYVDFILEELSEYKVAVEDEDTHGIIDALADIIVFSANEIANRGYDLDLVMKQVAKEILSRKGSLNEKTGKWEKDPNQDPSELYKANFELCKVKGK